MPDQIRLDGRSLSSTGAAGVIGSATLRLWPSAVRGLSQSTAARLTWKA